MHDHQLNNNSVYVLTWNAISKRLIGSSNSIINFPSTLNISMIAKHWGWTQMKWIRFSEENVKLKFPTKISVILHFNKDQRSTKFQIIK